MKLQEIKEGFKMMWKLFKTITVEELALALLNDFIDRIDYAKRLQKVTEEADNLIIERNRKGGNHAI